MNLLIISISYLISRLQNSILNIITMASGIMLITILLLGGYQIQEKLTNDAKGIDAVIGAKGSPLQLVLSSIYHIDIPTGNINEKDYHNISKHPLVKKAIPISLGDNYQNFRIVGTEYSYLKHFKASLKDGKIWKNNMEVILGYEVAKSTKLKIGDKFFGNHGLIEGGEIHDDKEYLIVGVLEKNNNILDKLIITSTASIWHIHNHHDEHKNHHNEHHHEEHNEHKHHHEEHHHDKQKAKKSNHSEAHKEITAILINFKNKMAMMSFPRHINKNSNLLAASPAFEISRLIKIIGIGKDSIMLFASFLIIISLSSILISLLNAVQQRRYDLAIFRTLGASRRKIFLIVITEGMIITIIGSLLGIIFGHLLIEIIATYSSNNRNLGITGFIFIPQILILWFANLILCFAICLIPAIKAYKTDIKEMLTHVQ